MQRALPASTMQEERGHVLIKSVGANSISLRATNKDFKASYKIDIITEEETATIKPFTVEPKSVLKLISKIKEDTIKIEVDYDSYIVRFYTSESMDSFVEAQTFQESVMLTFEDLPDAPEKQIEVNRASLVNTIEFAEEFLEDLKVEKERYDFISINNGLIYSANGSNKMGFRVDKSFKGLNDFKIRKLAVPMIKKTLAGLKDDSYKKILLFETSTDVGIASTEGDLFLSCLKSSVEGVTVKTELASSKGSHCVVDRKAFINSLDRIGVLEPAGRGMGIKMVLSGSGDKATIELESLGHAKGREVIKCERITKEGDSDDTIEHVVHNKLILGILGIFKSSTIRFFMNSESAKFFKIYEAGSDEDGETYHSFAIGAFSRVLRR